MSDHDGTMMLTIMLKHQQDKSLGEINDRLDAAEFWQNFPPDGCEIVSWYVMMGIGQVVTLRCPAGKLRDVNLVIERRAWGAFDTEFYATYDFRPRYDAIRQDLGLS